MLRIPLSTLLVGTALFVVPAGAQTNSADGQFITQQSPDQWRAYKMIGVNVYNPNNEKIGDVSEILLDKNGNAEVVVIGVGGFLGIGTKDVAVSFKSLQWKMDRPKTASGGAPPSTTGQGSPAQPSGARSSGPQGYPDHAVLNMTQDQLKTAPDFKYTGASESTQPPPSTPAPK
ncbi:MAG: PRC-barrel domain-containing protein [Rhodoplanes sp.]